MYILHREFDSERDETWADGLALVLLTPLHGLGDVVLDALTVEGVLACVTEATGKCEALRRLCLGTTYKQRENVRRIGDCVRGTRHEQRESVRRLDGMPFFPLRLRLVELVLC